MHRSLPEFLLFCPTSRSTPSRAHCWADGRTRRVWIPGYQPARRQVILPHKSLVSSSIKWNINTKLTELLVRINKSHTKLVSTRSIRQTPFGARLAYIRLSSFVFSKSPPNHPGNSLLGTGRQGDSGHLTPLAQWTLCSCHLVAVYENYLLLYIWKPLWRGRAREQSSGDDPQGMGKVS